MADGEIKKFILLVTALFPLTSSSSWLCKEASSQAQGDTFYACGHAVEENLAEARNKALEAAKSEFEAFCNDSENCKDNAYNIAPMRTDCTESEGKHSCYRGLEYTILKNKRKSMKVNKNEISKIIKQKEKELSDLEETLQEAIKLQQIEKRTEYLKKVDVKEVEIEQLDHMKEDYTSNAVEFKVILMGTPLKDRNKGSSKDISLIGFGAGYESIFNKNLSLKASISLLASDTKDPTENSRQAGVTYYKSHLGLDGNLALPFTFGNFTVAPNLGLLNLYYKSVQFQTTNGAKDEKSETYTSGYAGLGLRYGRKLYVEIEPRQYFKDSKTSYSFSLGFRIDY